MSNEPTELPTPIALPTMPTLPTVSAATLKANASSWDQAAVWDEKPEEETGSVGAVPAPPSGHTLTESPELLQERAIRALVEAQENEELLQGKVEELHGLCEKLLCERDSLRSERDELKATVDELLHHRADYREEPEPVPAPAPAEVAAQVCTPPPGLEPQSAAPSPWFPHPPVAASPKPRRATVSAFKRAFGDRRLSLFADELPDDLDYRAAKQIRRSRIPLGVMAGMVAVVGFLAFTYDSASEDLEARHAALLEKYSAEEPALVPLPLDKDVVASVTEAKTTPLRKNKRKRRVRRRR